MFRTAEIRQTLILVKKAPLEQTLTLSLKRILFGIWPIYNLICPLSILIV